MSEFQTYKNDLTKSRVVETDIGQALANLAQGDILVQASHGHVTNINAVDTHLTFISIIKAWY